MRTESTKDNNEVLPLRVLVVAEHASARFGGEAVLPLHYYRLLRKRNIPVWLLVHERTRAELQELYPGDGDRITYIPDSIWHRMLWGIGRFLPNRLSYFSTGLVMRFLTQLAQRRIIKRLVRDKQITVIHQPIPVSPKEPSMIFGMGIPVIIGPMNGGMNYPPAFQRKQNVLVGILIKAGRDFSGLMNYLMPGKRKAALLIVANARTRSALPHGACQQVLEFVENGVDLSLWRFPVLQRTTSPLTRFVFMGRLVDWKAVELLIQAFELVASRHPVCLTIIGDGDEKARLEQNARDLGVLGSTAERAGKVQFAGWLSQKECSERLCQHDVLVLPSLLECGGAVVLEAMAMGIPVIATNWGGPKDYLDDSCGILVEPSSKENFINGLATAMIRLAKSPQEREEMGKAGKEKITRCFDWEIKIDRMIEVYRDVVEAQTAKGGLRNVNSELLESKG